MLVRDTIRLLPPTWWGPSSKGRSAVRYEDVKVLCTFLVFLFAACSWCQGVGDTVGSPGAVGAASGVRVIQKLGSQIPLDAEFKDQSGNVVRFGEEIATRPVVVLPIFYRCKGVCEMETDQLLAALPTINKKVGKDFDVVILSIDPDEGPALAMDKFKSAIEPVAAYKGTANGWHLLTGSLDQIRRVTDALGFFYTFDAEHDVVNHPSGVMFLTPQGRVSSYILNANFTKDQLENNLNLAAKNTIGEKTADSFFGCVHTDPITGQKSMNILRFLSLFAFVFLMGVVSLLAYLHKSTKKLSSGTSTEE